MVETIVYCATNAANGHRYIGVTYELAQRQREHFLQARSNKRPTSFGSAIRKYGIAGFQFVVLSTWDTRDQALAEEVRLIAKQKPEYNMTSGGDGASVLTRRRAVIRLSDGRRYETVRSAATENDLSCMRIVQICRGGGCTKGGELFMYADQPGPPQSIRKTPEQLLEAKAKTLIAAAKGRATQSKPVVCADDGRHFPSISSAARHYGQHLTSVADALHRSGRAGGLKFEFSEAA